jgi:hypothetical protein
MAGAMSQGPLPVAASAGMLTALRPLKWTTKVGRGWLIATLGGPVSEEEEFYHQMLVARLKAIEEKKMKRIASQFTAKGCGLMGIRNDASTDSHDKCYNRLLADKICKSPALHGL